jgi:OOP family OmpA-OmpF porin
MKKIYALLLALLPLCMQAQQPWEWGVGAGLTYYFGDLDNFPDKFGVAKPGVQLSLRRHTGNFLSFRGNLIIGGIGGKDSKTIYADRGFSFKSPIFEGALLAEIHLLGKYKKGSNMPRKFSPFVFGGIGGVFLNPSVTWKKSDSPSVAAGIDADQKADASGGRAAIPFGGGFRWALNKTTFIGGELAYRYTNDDYIDGVSQAGNSANKDWYVIGMVTFSKAFGENKIRKSSPDGDAPMITAASLDKDKDGIPDAEDACPNLAGVAAYRGCPAVDKDKDGIADGEDKCPDMPGTRGFKGCPDSDKDGIGDYDDDCPGIPGTAAMGGCADGDKDGVADNKDKCPTLAGLVENEGCPANVSSKPANVPYKAIYFDSQKEDWFATSYTTMDETIKILNGDPSIKIRIEGHTDNTGDVPANNLLSELRARKCYEYLMSKGLAENRMTYIGYGARKPIATNETQDGRKLNRRVEIHFYK